MKTANDFREAVIKNNISYWSIRNCSICEYELAYLFFEHKNAEVIFDAGCDCTKRYVKHKADWSDVANFYNMNLPCEETIKAFDEFWGFDKEKTKSMFTDEQKDFICSQIGDWYLMMKPLLEGQHNLGYMKEKLKMMICGDE